MKYIEEIKTFLKLSSSADNPKSVKAIAESISIPEEEVGLAINHLLKTEDIIKIAEKGSFEGLQYYI